MDKSKDRWKSINTSFKQLKSSVKNELDIRYIRVKGLDGNSMNKNEKVKKILSPRPSLLGKQFIFQEVSYHWI